MLNILIIGVGTIGGYHLQSLSGLLESSNIYLYDTNKNSISKALNRLNESLTKKSKNQTLNPFVLNSLDELPNLIDFCIIATDSRSRKDTVINLIRKKNVKIKYMILEKFLFPKIDDYSIVSTEIEKYKTKIYVNEWMSSSYIFRRMSQFLNIENTYDPIEMRVEGAKWGLECNAVHYIDYFHYLTNRSDLKIKESNITEHSPSKRYGYIEFFGEIIVSSDNSCNLIMCSKKVGDESNVKVSLLKGDAQIDCIMWNNAQIDIIYKFKDIITLEHMKIPFQSEITREIIHNAIAYDAVNLPTLKEATLHHLLVCESLKKYCNENIPDFDQIQEFPIT